MFLYWNKIFKYLNIRNTLDFLFGPALTNIRSFQSNILFDETALRIKIWNGMSQTEPNLHGAASWNVNNSHFTCKNSKLKVAKNLEIVLWLVRSFKWGTKHKGIIRRNCVHCVWYAWCAIGQYYHITFLFFIKHFISF